MHDENDLAEVATAIWLQLPYHGIQDLPMHDELAHKLGQRILELLLHDPITQQMLEDHDATLLTISTLHYR